MRIHGARVELRGVPKHFGLREAAQREEQQGEEEPDLQACFSIVSPPETSNFPGASTLRVFTTPSSTSIE